MKKKWKVFVIVTAGVLLCLLAVAVAGVLRYVDSLRDGKLIKATDSVPFDYTLYIEHVVLEKYTGGEAEVTVPERIKGRPVTKIGDWCFEDAGQLTRVTLHDKIKVIGKNAFICCSNLKEVTGGKNVQYIDDFAFYKCTGLEKAEVGDRLRVIGKSAFFKCRKLRSLPAQENLKYIDTHAFFKSGLEEFEFNRDVRTSGEAFAETPWLRDQDSGFLIYGNGDLIAYTGTDKKVVIPKEVKSLTTGCFYREEGLEIYVSSGATTIREGAISQCKDIRIYIPNRFLGTEDQENWIWSIVNQSENVTICTTKNSCIISYAQEQGIPCEIVKGW